MALLRYFDVAVLVIATPIMLLIGVPAGGYLLGAGAWIVLRAIGVGIEHAAVAVPEASQQIGLRLAFLAKENGGIVPGLHAWCTHLVSAKQGSQPLGRV